MSLPYTLIEKSVLRKPNSDKSIGTVLTDSISWMNSLEEGNSVTNFFYYAEVIDSDTKARYFVYSDEAVQYFELTDNIVEADVAGSSSNGNTVPVQEMPSYSTEEVLTTERWIDGKPIYRKVIERDSSEVKGNSWDVLIDYSYLNVDNIVCGEWGVNNGIFVANDVSNNEWVKAASFEQNALSGRIGTEFTGMLRGNFSYTKTTDTAESPVANLSIAVGSDIYSEEETLTNKVWMGKAVYRKVLTGITDDDANDIELNPDIGEVENCKVIDFSVHDNIGNLTTSTNSYYVNDTGEFRAYSKADGSLVSLLIPDGNDNIKNAPYTITIEYTKL